MTPACKRSGGVEPTRLLHHPHFLCLSSHTPSTSWSPPFARPAVPSHSESLWPAASASVCQCVPTRHALLALSACVLVNEDKCETGLALALLPHKRVHSSHLILGQSSSRIPANTSSSALSTSICIATMGDIFQEVSRRCKQEGSDLAQSHANFVCLTFNRSILLSPCSCMRPADT